MAAQAAGHEGDLSHEIQLAGNDEIAKLIVAFTPRVDPAERPLPPDRKRMGRDRKKKNVNPKTGKTGFDLRTESYKLFGVDLTQIPGLMAMVLMLFSELGRDMSRWPTAGQFVSWLALCPDNDISGGRVLWRGEDALADLPLHARRIAYVGHQDAVKPGLTAAENLAFPARIGGIAVGVGLAAMGLSALADLPARMLSAGQRRRLALARLALSPALLWLVDEPTLGLDARAVELFGALASEHRGRGGLVVAATHAVLPLPVAAELRLG